MKILMLAGNSVFTDYVFNAISSVHKIEHVIIENGVKKSVFLKRRIKRIGLLKVIGQILFSLIIVPFLKKKSQKRIDYLIKNYNINTDNSYRKTDVTRFVNTVNDDEVRDILSKENPDVVIVQGTGIIKRDILECCNATFINMHVGITPKYRGVHGGYWALVNRDYDNFGVTVHLVDTGIDTGNIIYQKKCLPSDNDNFVTYPYLQIFEGINLHLRAIDDIKSNKLKAISNNLESAIWTHPTLFEYLNNKVK